MASNEFNVEPPRFVILLHEMPQRDGRGTHWDFMLEEDESLAVWAIEAEPDRIEMEIPCLQLPPHRKHYLDYEGPVSKNRGNVTRFDAGTFSWIERSDSRVVVLVDGEKLVGEIEFTRHSDDAGDAWTFRVRPKE